jgi:hypothetical protein
MENKLGLTREGKNAQGSDGPTKGAASSLEKMTVAIFSGLVQEGGATGTEEAQLMVMAWRQHDIQRRKYHWEEAGIVKMGEPVKGLMGHKEWWKVITYWNELVV